MNILKRIGKALSFRSQQVDLSGANNLFGTIATNRLGVGGEFGFIPIDNQGGILELNGDNVNPQWLGLDSVNMQYWAYQYCSPLASVIDRLAEADTNGRLEFINSDYTTVKNPNKIPNLSRIKRLLNKPNPWQTWEEFNSEQIVIAKTYGFCPVFAIGPAGIDKSYTKALVNLNPFYCRPTFNYQFSLFEDEGPIKSWLITILGNTYTIENEDILLIKDGFINSPTLNNCLPLSKIAGLDYWVSNICAAMEADNVLLKKKGPLGIFSYDAKPDPAGITPMTPGAKDALQEDLKRYGLTTNQLQYVVSKWPVKWNPMSFNLRDLMTKETVRQGIDGICDRFGYPAELMSGKNATYENRRSAEQFLYQTTIIPFSLRRMARYNEFFGLYSEHKLMLDYDHLAVLQEDIMHAGQAKKAQSEGLVLDWTNGIITWNEYREELDMDTIPGGDIYYPEWIKQNPEMQKQPKNEAPSKN